MDKTQPRGIERIPKELNGFFVLQLATTWGSVFQRKIIKSHKNHINFTINIY